MWCDDSLVGKIDAPQRAQEMLSLVLLMPAIVVEVGCVEDSEKRVAANMGSIMSWPE